MFILQDLDQSPRRFRPRASATRRGRRKVVSDPDLAELREALDQPKQSLAETIPVQPTAKKEVAIRQERAAL